MTKIDCQINKSEWFGGCPDAKPVDKRREGNDWYSFTHWLCDYPFIGKVKAEPDKMPK